MKKSFCYLLLVVFYCMFYFHPVKLFAQCNQYDQPIASDQALNLDDTLSCLNVLCTGQWSFQKRHSQDTTSQPISDILNDNQKAGYSINLLETSFTFHKNHTYVITGKAIYQRWNGGPGNKVWKDSTITGTWRLGEESTEFFGGNYNIKRRDIEINKEGFNYHLIVPELVQAGAIVSCWCNGRNGQFSSGSSYGYFDFTMKNPFLHAGNFIWVHNMQQLAIQDAKTQTKTETFILKGGFFSPRSSDNYISFTNTDGKVAYAEVIDTCFNNGKDCLWESGNIGQKSINSNLISKKFTITYVVISIADPDSGDMVQGMHIVKMEMK